MKPEVFKTSIMIKERLSGAFDASTPQQWELEWATHRSPILRAASAQLPTMVAMFVERNHTEDSAQTEFCANYTQSIADICQVPPPPPTTIKGTRIGLRTYRFRAQPRFPANLQYASVRGCGIFLPPLETSGCLRVSAKP